MLLVTGGDGFIGSYLMKELKDYPIRLLTLDPVGAKNRFPEVEVFKGDITKRETLVDAVKGVDKIIHLAGIVSYSKPKEELFKINTQGTDNLLSVCKKIKKIVFASSVSVMGEVKDKIDETCPVNPRDAYAESKLEAERIIQNYGFNHVNLRFAPIYGKGSPQWLKNLKLLEKGFPIPRINNLTHVLHVSNAVQALTLALEKGKGNYLIADPEPVGFAAMTETLVELLGLKPKHVPMSFAKVIARARGLGNYLKVLTMYRHYDISKAKKELGYKPVERMDAWLKEMVDWYKSTTKG